MLFANTGTATIVKEIKGTVYSCAPGELVDIPDELSYVVKTEGVALVPADTVTAKPDPEQPAKQEHNHKRR